MPTYCYVYVLRSTKDGQFYVGLTRDLRARLLAHNKGQVVSTKRLVPLELIYWEGCLNESDAAQREKYLKSAWGKRYIKGRLRRYLTGSRMWILSAIKSWFMAARGRRIEPRCCRTRGSLNSRGIWTGWVCFGTRMGRGGLAGVI